MTTKRIAITFEGPGVDERGVPVDDLQRALGHVQRALELTVRHLAGLHVVDPLPESLKAQCELRVVGIYRGSLTVELELKSEGALPSDSDDLGAQALDAVLDWCSGGAQGATPLQPAAAAELAAVREDLSSNLTAVKLARMSPPPSSRPKRPPPSHAAEWRSNGEKLEAHLHGTLSEVDWGRRTARLRQHGGTPVPLRFGADLDEDMLRLATQYVEVEGEGCIEADDERWTSVDVRRITGTRSCFEPFDLGELDGKAGFVFGRDEVVTVSDLYDHAEFMRVIREARGSAGSVVDVKGQTNAVLDTSVVSILFGDTRKSPLYSKELVGLRGVISFQTLEEVWFGAFLAGWGTRRRAELAAHLNQYLVIWPNPDLVDRCARLRTARRAAGKELSTADAWIAATAIMLGCPLASDDGDFDRIPGLEVVRIE